MVSNSLTWLCANQQRHGRGKARTGVEITRSDLRAPVESKRNACALFGLQVRSKNSRKNSKQVSRLKIEAHYMTLNIVSVKEFRLWVHSIVVDAVRLVGYRVK